MHSGCPCTHFCEMEAVSLTGKHSQNKRNSKCISCVCCPWDESNFANFENSREDVEEVAHVFSILPPYRNKETHIEQKSRKKFGEE